MKKNIILLTLILILGAAFSGCSNEVAEPTEPVQFSFMEGVTALTAAKMMSDEPDLGREIQYDVLKAPDLLAASILKEEADIAMVPTNLAAQAYNKDLPYLIVGTSTWGNLYVAGTEDVQTVADLKDMTLHTFGKGLTPELVLLMILQDNGLDPETDMDIQYMGSAAEIGPFLLSGQASLGVLPEPAISGVVMKGDGIEVLLDLNSLWAEAKGVTKGYPQACLVIKKTLIEEDPEFVENFLLEYNNSIQWANENPEALGDISEELALGPVKGAVVQGIDRMNIGDFPIEDSLEEYRVYYQAIMDFAPDFIGGELPDEEIYYTR
ncbi:ABC transporter substrate-binding protein [Gudongella sp. DL1XJH-153]|uniref:ABC transporter substrate-binding protein n=1 Tax=Gudongella sp. DL1XJH-153 TaxID=3409804 RepID=UPI003BB64472